jgi:hypothetical protein
MRRGKGAVSEVVAALMLISIVVAAAFIIYVYSSNLLGSLTGAQPSTGQYSNQITLEYYDWTVDQSGPAQCSLSYTPLNCGTLVLQIRNVGTGLANIAAYYVNGVRITTVSYTCPTLSGTVTVTSTSLTTVANLMPQASCSVKLTMPTGTTYSTGCSTAVTTTNLQTICVGLTYSIQIATTSGGIFAYNCVAGERTGSY